jgi:hypothetical protein
VSSQLPSKTFCRQEASRHFEALGCERSDSSPIAGDTIALVLLANSDPAQARLAITNTSLLRDVLPLAGKNALARQEVAA